MGGRSTARGLVWLAFAGQAVFAASWITAGAVEPHYTHVLQGVSELAARHAPDRWIVTAGLVVLGASFVALAGALWLSLPRRRALPVVLFAAVGALFVFAAAVPVDCDFSSPHCRDLWHAGALSWHQDGHLWADVALNLALLATPFALARALWPGTPAATALHAAGVGVVIAVLSSIAYGVHGAAGGLIQRVDLGVMHVWVLIVGGGILYATRGAPRTSALIPMRPREFLARTWTGEGELVLRPFLLGRLFRQRVEARRESMWISEQVWRIDDEAHFGGGRFERRHMFCEFVSADHVRLTGNDMPDGADVWLEPDGFRLSEWRMAWPIGPVPVIVRCVDRSYFEPDGTFVNTIDVYSLGPRIPLARVTFRMRTLETETPSEAKRRALEEVP